MMRRKVEVQMVLILLLAVFVGPELGVAVNGSGEGKVQEPVFSVILQKDDREIVGTLKMHFKQKFEAEWESGLFEVEFDKIEELEPVDVNKKTVSIKLVSGEKVEVKLINALYLDKTAFGKYDIHLANIKKIVRKK